ncbi:MAG: ABC transporter ATP-binding protein [Clostridia bacterium]
MIRVRNLTKTYVIGETKVVAVDDLSLNIEKGEFIALVGESGSGKSTLFHLIAGLDKPDCGSVFFDNVDIFTKKRDYVTIFRRNNIGLIYQFYNLVPILTVEENILLPVRLDRKSIDKDKLNSLLEKLDLMDRRKHLPNQLSGGQQQRVAIARALFNNPKIILADEPTGNLDSKNSEEIIKYLELLNVEFNQTIFMITHSNEVAKRASRIITIADGKIVGDERK